MKRMRWGIGLLGAFCAWWGNVTLVQAAACPAGLRLATPTVDFIDNQDGTVTHTKTGLIWAKCSEGQTYANGACAGSVTLMNWSAALVAARASTLAGFTDWRLPSLKELESILETGCYSPSINDSLFPATQSEAYWTATTWSANPAVAWVVGFDLGRSGAVVKTNNGLDVRLVRGGQSFDALNAVSPTDLAIASVNGGLNPHRSAPFNLAIEARNGGALAPVSAATSVQLSVQAGTGSLGGTTSCTIPVAASTCVLTGVTYSQAETGVVLRASASGLGSGDSPPFDVLAAVAVGFNDSGQSTCYDGSAMVACTAANTGDGSSTPRQDGRYGRDAAAAAGALSKTGGGAAGFDFTKIANDGSDLLASATLGNGATDWACTRDNVTGLMWEVKTATANTDLRYWGHNYTWYSTDGSSNGGNAGSTGSNTCNGTLSAYSNQCNTANYVAAVNAANLCNHNDWRLPSLDELQGLAHLGTWSPSIDPSYFPNTQSSWYWTATNYAANPAGAWNVYFGSGDSGVNGKADNYGVRLVRGGQ